ncbi:LysM peptidoglycan-binding domain-containing protein [Ruania zhangjianzhongii]|nr:LysM peptidoglycan-binding domain-containing protein [Ruania zhangjianzhongii]
MSALAFPTAPLTVPSRRRHLRAVPDLPAAPLPVAETESRPADTSAALRLTVRGRVVLVALAFAVAAAVGVGAGLAFPEAEPMPEQVQSVTVGPGESLWTIAADVAADGQDVRVVIDQIMALNNLSASTVHAGAELTVPSGE